MASAILCVGLTLLLACASAQQLLLQGRSDNVNLQTGFGSLPVKLSWPASSVYVTFEGSSINATLSASPGTVISSQFTRFAFLLDQQQVALEATSTNSTVINWGVSGLGSGGHNLTIIKLSEASYGSASLDALSLGPGGRFLAPSLPNAFRSGRRIQFIGDSYTAGFGNVGGTTHCNLTLCAADGQCSPELDSQNSALAYGPLTAANFSADYQVLAWSGAGLDVYTHNMALDNGSLIYYAGKLQPDLLAVTPEVPNLFTRQVADSNITRVANYSSWRPQIVVLAAGVNDFHSNISVPPLTNWTADSVAFLNMINDVYDEPTIITQVFPPEISAQGVLRPEQIAVYLDYMQSLYNTTQAANMTNVHLFQLNGTDIPLDNWCVKHPSAAAHANVAAQLTAYIGTIMPEWGTSTYPLSVTV